MLPSEILPAIPRQKVKNKDGRIGSVLCKDSIEHDVNEPFTEAVLVLVHPDQGCATYQDIWPTEDCEPVPEEPRPFRVGDKVVFGNVWFCKIIAVNSFPGYSSFRLSTGMDVHQEQLRHPKPEEISKYFS